MSNAPKRSTSRPSLREAGAASPRPLLALLAVALLAAVVLGATAASAAAPVVTAEAATQIGVTSAQAKGTVDPEGGEVGECRFEYIADAQFGQNPSEPWEGASQAQCPGLPLTGGSQGVEAELTGLQPGTEYHLRLIAVNSESERSEDVAPTFETKPATAPDVEVTGTSAVEFTEATLEGSINPKGGNSNPIEGTLPIEWQLQYAPASEAEPRNWQNAAPQGEDPIGGEAPAEAESSSPIVVTAKATELTNATEYAFRLLATYAGGIQKASATQGTFTTQAVTPPEVSGFASSSLTSESVHLTGKVDPGGSDPAFKTTWTITCTPQPCPDAENHGLEGTVPGGGAQEITADAAIEPTRHYTATLKAVNAGGSDEETIEFGAPAAAPTLQTFDAGPLQATSTYLNGEVNAHNLPTSYWFEWGTSDCSGGGCTATPKQPAAPNELQQLVISADAGTFTVGFEGQTTGDLPFNATPAALAAALESLSTIGAGNVSVTGGRANENGIPQNRFHITFSGSLATTDTPSIDASLSGPGGTEVRTILDGGYSNYFTFASAHLTGLQPQTTYHYRLLAENGSGTTAGPDRTFTTPAPEPPCTNAGALGTGFLPDCRAWEMVSPPEKNGIEVIPQTNKVHVRPDGSAATFAAAGNFADSKGSSLDTEYLATRTADPGTNGWATHATNPPGRATSSVELNGNSATYVDAFTPDLSEAIYRSWRPLIGTTHLENFAQLYRVAGLTEGEPHATEILTDAYTNTTEAWPARFLGNKGIYFVGASEDLNQVYFETVIPLTPDAPGQAGLGCQLLGGCPNSLYENRGLGSRLVGRIPAPGEEECDDTAGEGCQTAASSQAAISAKGFRYSERAVSADGRRIYFEAPVSSRTLYLREDGTRTYRVADQAVFGDASRDGSRVFFISEEQLLPADTDSQPDVYMWNRAEPAGEHLTLVSASSRSAYADVVVGASSDGHTVYFVSDGQLSQGAPPIGVAGLYRWHDEKIDYLGRLADTTEGELNSGRNWQYVNSKKTSRITPDGRHFLFMTRGGSFAGRGGFRGYDHAGMQELYVYEADTGRLQCATCNPSRAVAQADSVIDVRGGATTSAITSDSAHALSDDGRFVFFNSKESLVSEDTNGTWDAYEFDAVTGDAHLLSSGTDPSPSYFVDATDDGSNAFIVTRQRLSGWDYDGAYDLYDARVNGGVPEPPPTPATCEGESCPPAAASAPAVAAAGSESAAEGNPKRPARCAKGKVRRHGRCAVRKKRHHRVHHHRKPTAAHRHGRAANADRRNSK